MTQILPTVGRKVYFYADDKQERPFDATIIFIHDPDEQGRGRSPEAPVNLFVVAGNGMTFTATEVTCQPDGAPRQHYRWMPYQLQQESKSQAARLAEQINTDAQGAKKEEEGVTFDEAGEKGQFEKANAEREAKERDARAQQARPAQDKHLSDDVGMKPPHNVSAPAPAQPTAPIPMPTKSHPPKK